MTTTNRLASASAAVIVFLTLWVSTVSEPAMAAVGVVAPALA